MTYNFSSKQKPVTLYSLSQPNSVVIARENSVLCMMNIWQWNKMSRHKLHRTTSWICSVTTSQHFLGVPSWKQPSTPLQLRWFHMCLDNFACSRWAKRPCTVREIRWRGSLDFPQTRTITIYTDTRKIARRLPQQYCTFLASMSVEKFKN